MIKRLKYWKAHFRPDEAGIWNYKVSFKKGKYIAVIEGKNQGEPINLNGSEGAIEINESDKSGVDFRTKGRIVNGKDILNSRERIKSG